MFRAIGRLAGHNDDVKAVAGTSNNRIATVARDGALMVWEPSGSGYHCQLAYTGTGFLNCVASANDQTNRLYIGGAEGSIVEVTLGDFTGQTATQTNRFLGHSANVCTLAVNSKKQNTIASGSWDNTARVWNTATGQCEYTMQHNHAVWAVAWVGPDTLVTGSADLGIRIWQHGRQVAIIEKAHEAAVRGIAVLEEEGDVDDGTVTFASCSNDSLIKIWRYNGKINPGEILLKRTIVGHTNFIYTLTALGSLLASGSEDRTVRLWDWRSGECMQVIVMPMLSVWSIAALGENKFVCAGSDFCGWVFSRALEDQNLVVAEDLRQKVASFSCDKQLLQGSGVSLVPQPKSILEGGGIQGQTIVVRPEEFGPVYVYMYNNAEWEQIGVVADVGGPSQKAVYNGVEYDYVFEVDADNKMLKLAYNLSDNPFIVAQKFVEDNELPHSYVDNIVQFIQQNTQGVTVGDIGMGQGPQPSSASSSSAAAARAGPSSSSAASSSRPRVQTKIVPFTSHVGLVAFNADGLLKALKTKNAAVQSEATLSGTELHDIEAALKKNSVLTSYDANTLVPIVLRVHDGWPPEDRLPVADLMRLAVGSAQNPSEFLQPIFSDLDPEQPKLAVVATRALVNLFSNAQGLPLVTHAAVAGEILPTVEKMVEQLHMDKLTQLAVSSLALNYASSYDKISALGDVLLRFIAAVAFKISASGQTADPESVYRLLLAVGTVLAKSGPSEECVALVQSLGVDEWIYKVPSDEARVKPLVEEIDMLLKHTN